jgi:hypothetical protein
VGTQRDLEDERAISTADGQKVAGKFLFCIYFVYNWNLFSSISNDTLIQRDGTLDSSKHQQKRAKILGKYSSSWCGLLTNGVKHKARFLLNQKKNN